MGIHFFKGLCDLTRGHTLRMGSENPIIHCFEAALIFFHQTGVQGCFLDHAACLLGIDRHRFEVSSECCHYG
jgi:hypothetical protein